MLDYNIQFLIVNVTFKTTVMYCYLSSLISIFTFYSSLFLLIMPVLANVKVPHDKDAIEQLFRFSEKPQMAKQFADFMLDMLLLPYG